MLGFDDAALIALAYLAGKMIYEFLQGLGGNGHDGKIIKRSVS